MKPHYNKSSLIPGAPPLLNASALLFWGWQCEYLPYAFIMAVIFLMPVIFRFRFQFDDNEFNHFTDLSTIIFLLTAIYVFSKHSFHGIFELLALLPFIFYLLVLSQLFSTQEGIKTSALFISLRRLEKYQPESIRTVNLTFPYFFICLLSASEGNQYPQIFYAGLVLLLMWAFWSLQNRRKSMIAWVLIFSFAIPSGYAMQIGIENLQSRVESTLMGWIDHFMWRSRDPQRTSTAIGTLGKLKLSDRIVVRVEIDNLPDGNSILLRESSYLNYSHGVWTNYQNTLQLVDPLPDGNSWQINNTTRDLNNLAISFYMDNEISIIPLPIGTSKIYNVTASEILHSPYGATSLELNPGWIKYSTDYQDNNFDTEPGHDELDIPDIYRDELEQLSDQLGLDTLSPLAAIDRTKRYFLNNYEYSLTQRQRFPRGRYLSKFLFETKRGHCEYFATATALLLRAAGIPTRYTVGYSIQEYSQLEGQYIGRASHAHSWIQAYAEGKWHTVDTTPPQWIVQEQQEMSFITPLVDFWSWLNYRLSTDNTADEEDGNLSLLWLLLPVLFYYLWQMRLNKSIKYKNRNEAEINQVIKQGMDSPFYAICQQLEKIHGKRTDAQTLKQWIDKNRSFNHTNTIKYLLNLHYCYRFDPAGLSKKQYNEMKIKAHKLLKILQNEDTNTPLPKS